MAVATWVGDFIPPISTGNQDITTDGAGIALPDLTGSTPWALIVNYTGSATTAGTWAGNVVQSLGYIAWDGSTLTQYAVGFFALDATTAAAAQTSRRTAAKAIAVPNTAGSAAFEEATVAALAGGGLRFNWSTLTNANGRCHINFQLITGLTGAKAINWGKATGAGNKAVTGVGFSSDLVLHAQAASIAVPASYSTAYMGIGAMNKQGQQWANSIIAVNNASNSSRWQQTDACLLTADSSESTSSQAHFVSMDSDGFTTYFSQEANFGGDLQVISLCMNGISSKVGAVIAPTTASTQIVPSRHGFTARGLLLTSVQSTLMAAPTTTGQWALGFADGTNQAASAVTIDDGAPISVARSVWSDTVVHDSGYNGSTYNVASLTSFGTDDFTLNWTTATGGTEQLYLLVGDDGVDPFPSLVHTEPGEVQQGGSYSNEKKAVTLSTGKMVTFSQWFSGGPGIYLLHSNDGKAWSLMSAGYQIDGWDHGSITSILLNGTEYLLATWVQSGTGGSRTTGQAYAMIGSFDSARTSITWGTAVDITGGANTNFKYPDIAVVPTPGSTTTAEVVIVASYNGGTASNYAVMQHFQMSSTTVGSSLTDSGTGSFSGRWRQLNTTDHGVNLHTFPSISANTTTGDFYVGWSAGTTGAGKGLRFKKGANSTGTITWATEVEVDNAHYVSDTGAHIICRWDGTRVVMGGQVKDGSANYDLVLHESTNFTSFTTRTIVDNDTTSDAGTNTFYGTMVIDTVTGDVYFIGSSWTANYLRFRKWTRSTTTLGAITNIDECGTAGILYTYAWFSGSTIRWIYTRGNNAPYAVTYDQKLLNVAPLAPTLTTPANASTIDLAATPTFAGTFNDPGDTISAYYLRRKVSGAGSYEFWNATTSLFQGTEIKNAITGALSVAFTAGKWSNSVTYNWSFDTEDASGTRGVYASDFTVTGSTPATVTVTAPATTATSSSPAVVWSVSDVESDPQQTYQIKVESGAYSTTPGSGTSVWDSTETTDVSGLTRSRNIGVTLANATSYRVFVRVKTNNQYSSWAYSTFTTSFLAPAIPTVTATQDSALGRIAVTVQGRDNLLTQNQGSIETDTTGWAAGTSTSIARSTSQALDGSASLSLTRNTTTGTASATTPTGTSGFATIPGKTYMALASFRAAATPRSCSVNVVWYDAAGSVISTSTGTTTADTTSGWTQVTLAATAPALAVYGSITVLVAAAIATEVHYVDCILIAPGASTTWTRGGFAGLATFTLERSFDAGANWVAFRDGTAVTIPTAADQSVTLYDREAPPRTSMSYRASITVAS